MVTHDVYMLLLCCSAMQQTAAMYYEYDSPEEGYRGYGGTGGYNGYYNQGYGGYGSDEGLSEEFDSPEVDYSRGYDATRFNSNQKGHGRYDGYPQYSDNDHYGDNDDYDDGHGYMMQPQGPKPCALKRNNNGRYKRMFVENPIPCNCIFEWRPDSDQFNPPLVLMEISRINYDIVLPKFSGNKRKIKLSSGNNVIISCPNEDTLATCKADNNGLLRLTDISTQREIKEKGCTSKIKATIQKTAKTCGENSDTGNMVYIGFQTNTKPDPTEPPYFYPQIRVCFNADSMKTLWSQHILRGSNYAARVTSRDPDGERSDSWNDDMKMFKDIGIAGAYRTENQYSLLHEQLKWDQNPITKITKPKPLPTKRKKRGKLAVNTNNKKKKVSTPKKKTSKSTSGFYLAKGHLSPNADFVTAAERKATFSYINALPQWQKNNNGNWKSIVEASVQRLAGAQEIDLIIITGGHGTMKLKDNNKQGVDVPIFLTAKGKVPVPEFMWKVVYKRNPEEAVAFVLINSPFPATATTKPLCTDVCSSLDPKWFNPKNIDRTDYSIGYTYCCKVADLRNNIPTIPAEYAVSQLLGMKGQGNELKQH